MTRAQIIAAVAVALIAACAGLAVWLIDHGRDAAETERAAQDGADYIGGSRDADDATGNLPADDNALIRLLRAVAGTAAPE